MHLSIIVAELKQNSMLGHEYKVMQKSACVGPQDAANEAADCSLCLVPRELRDKGHEQEPDLQEQLEVKAVLPKLWVVCC